MFLLIAKFVSDRPFTDFTHASLQSSLFLNLVQTHSFYLVPGAAVSIQSYAVPLCDTRNI